MAMKPGKIEALGKGLVVPFSRFRLAKMNAVSDPQVSFAGTSVPYEISQNVIKKINDAKFGGFVNFLRAAGNPETAVDALKKSDAANSGLIKNILNSIVVKDGKYYYRTKDSLLHSLKEIRGEDISKFVKENPAEDLTKLLLKNTYGGAVPTSHIVANAAHMTGAKVPREIIASPGGSLYSVPTTYTASTDSMVINNPRLTAPTHEFFHKKDYANSFRKMLPTIGRSVAATSLVGTPVSLLYGDKLSSVIPGTVDDKIINTLKAVGPEIFLAGSAIQHSPEFFANKQTKNLIKNNPAYFGDMSKFVGGPSNVQDLVDVQDVKARTYPSGILTNYGLLRLGTLPMLLSKSSSLDVPKVSPAEYAGVAKNIFKSHWEAIKNLIRGATDKNVLQGMLYHDSANKYKSIPGTINPLLLAPLLPAIAIDQYFSEHKKPKAVIVGQPYSNSIKQGLGA